MNRHPRDAGWDDTSLSDYPTDNISPVALNDDPVDSDEIIKSLYDWLYAIYNQTKTFGREHAFYLDGYGNVIGTISGTETNVTYPDDYRMNRVNTVHTHPSGSPIMSEGDILSTANNNHYGYGTSSILPITEGDTTFLVSFSYTRPGDVSGGYTGDPVEISKQYKSVAEDYMRRFGVEFDTNRVDNVILGIEDTLSDLDGIKFKLTHSEVSF